MTAKKTPLPAKLRPMPFWAWNGTLAADEIRSQIRDMKRMGFGGFFIHSRYGLETPYLGEKWFDCVRAAIDEAQKQGILPWLYDEDRWPSGSAGGEVTRSHPEYAQQGLDCVLEDPECPPVFSGIAHFALRMANGAMTGYRRLHEGEALEMDERFLRVFTVTVPESSVCNGARPPDLMNPDAVACFIRCTHEKYRDRLGPLLKEVPGIFTDEPTYNGFAGKLPWTPRLPELFKAKCAYDLLDRLPELFFELDGRQVSKTRLDFHELITGLFTDAYARQIYGWCEENGLRFAGHVLGEEDLLSQMMACGAAMRFYEHMHIPGIDVLSEHWNLYAAAKQCSSVARQGGRECALAEYCGCTGWDFPLEGHKAIGDWLMALGIDLLVPHHFWYSAAGESKRDYPADISPRSPYWECYSAIAEHVASVSRAFAGMEPVREILVIHPIESVWFGRPMEAYGREAALNVNGAFVHTGEKKAKEQGRLQKITDLLLGAHRDFDFGDESQLARLAKVQGGSIHVGHAAYRTVVIPEVLTIRKTTLELLCGLIRQGGEVLHAGDAPQYMDGVPSPHPAECWRLFRALDMRRLPCTVSVADDSGRELPSLLYRLGRSDGMEALFLCNVSAEPREDVHAFPPISERRIACPAVTVRWKLPEGMRVYESAGGALLEAPAERDGAWMVLHTAFDRLESRLFIARKESSAVPEAVQEVPREFALPEGPFEYALSEENLLVLDMPEAVAGDDPLPRMHFLELDAELRRRIGTAPRSIMAVQPWRSHGRKTVNAIPVRLRFRIFCRCVPDAAQLLMESPAGWQFALNGRRFDPADAGCKWDASIRRLKIPQLESGENLLELSTSFSAQTTLESLFLCGRFAVFDDCLDRLPPRIARGDWTGQGLPYYAGNVIFEIPLDSRDGRPVCLDLSQSHGSAFRIRLNDGEEQICAFPPYRVELRPHCGRNRILVTVCGSLRNAFGPFYAGKEPFLVTPRTFRQYESAQRQLVAYGL